MLTDFLQSLNSNDSDNIFHQSIKELCTQGMVFENFFKSENSSQDYASSYIVHSKKSFCASLILGDIRYVNSYSNLLTIRKTESEKIVIDTINYDNFGEEYFELTAPLTEDIFIKCLQSSYNTNILKYLTKQFSETNTDECSIQIRTGIFWSTIKSPVDDCQKIFRCIGKENVQFDFNMPSNQKDPQHPLTELKTKFPKQTNQININGIQFKTKIHHGVITITPFSEDGTIEFIRHE